MKMIVVIMNSIIIMIIILVILVIINIVISEVLRYGGLFCALTAREGASGVGSEGSLDAWGEVWHYYHDYYHH